LSDGWATGTALGAWLLPLAASLACLVPSPLRDLKTGELIARDTLRGRRGSWADLFTRDFWTRGPDWGGREAALGTGAGLGAGAGAAYEERRAPAGTGYRETTTGYGKEEPRESYRYGTSREEAERLERERRGGGGLMGTLFGRKEERPLTEREREQREREWRAERERGGYYGAGERGYGERERERGGQPLTTGSAPSSTTGTYESGRGYHTTIEPQTVGSTTTSTAVSREPSAIEEVTA
jgi:hypothetical protein